MIAHVTKQRRLPTKGRVLVSLGEQVRADTPIGKLDYVPGQLTKYPVAEELCISPVHLQKTMLKRVGDWVAEGEPLAAASEFGVRRIVRSPGQGYLGLVSHLLGDVYIRSPLPAGPKEPVIVSAKEHDISPLAFFMNLLVQVDDRVEVGQELVVEPLKTKSTVVSPVFGVVTEISRANASITINPIYQATEVLAHISGCVTGVVDGESVEVSTEAHVVQGIIGYGGEHIGRLLPLADTGRDLAPDDLPAELTDAVVVCRHGVTAAALQRLADGGAAGVIAGAIRYNALNDFLGIDPLKANGRIVDTPLTIILMQGFGDIPMAFEPYAELSALGGRTASIDGSTQLRAGVVRPEVIVPLSEATGPAIEMEALA